MSAVATAAPLSRSAALVPAIRAALALALGLVITFASDHSAGFGILCFGVFAIATALGEGASSLLQRGRGVPLALIQAIVTLVAGVVAFLVPAGTGFTLVASGWAIVAGAIELVAGVQARKNASVGAGFGGAESPRDAIIAGALALLLGVALLVIPPDFYEPWSVADDSTGAVEATGAVTASIMSVGALGAWAVLHAVALGIAAASVFGKQK